MKRDIPKPGRCVTRRQLAETLGLSIRTIDEHGLARGVLLSRQEAAARAGLAFRTFERRREQGDFPKPSLILSNRPFWSQKIVDLWIVRQTSQLLMEFDGK